MATSEQKFSQTRKTNVTGMKRIEVYHLLRIRNRMLYKCKVFAEPETAPLGTNPLT